MTLYSIIHGPEAWLALTIFCMGASFSMMLSMPLMLKDVRRKMINAFHLLWIVPVCFTAGMLFAAMLSANGR